MGIGNALSTAADGSMGYLDATGKSEAAVGGALITATSAPADGDLTAGQMVIWFDPTNGAGKLMVKAKTLNGTVVTGSLSLA